jgi:hypothetical protein
MSSSSKSRSKRNILFRTRSSAGVLLTPKQVLQHLKEKHAIKNFQFNSGNKSAELQKQLQQLKRELDIAEKFMTTEAKRAAKSRAKSVESGKVQKVKKIIAHFSESELVTVRNDIEILLLSSKGQQQTTSHHCKTTEQEDKNISEINHLLPHAHEELFSSATPAVNSEKEETSLWSTLTSFLT